MGWRQLGERLWLGKVGIKPECKNGLRVTDGDGKWTKAKTYCLQDVVLPLVYPPFHAALLMPSMSRSHQIVTYRSSNWINNSPFAAPCPRCCAGATMEIVEMVLGGRVNKSLVSLIQQVGAGD